MDGEQNALSFGEISNTSAMHEYLFIEKAAFDQAELVTVL